MATYDVFLYNEKTKKHAKATYSALSEADAFEQAAAVAYKDFVPRKSRRHIDGPHNCMDCPRFAKEAAVKKVDESEEA